jgi:hypothetical protein
MKTLSYKHPVNCWLIESALYEAKALIDSKDSLKSKDKIIFGSKKQFNLENAVTMLTVLPKLCSVRAKISISPVDPPPNLKFNFVVIKTILITRD